MNYKAVKLERSSLAFESDRLACYRLVPGHGVARGMIVMLHGAGKADKERTIDLALELAARDYAVVAMDFAGHGMSTGVLAEQSLEHRFRQASLLVESSVPEDLPITLVGFSMSGQTVADLLTALGRRVERIGLCSPAIYAADAWNVRFDSGFTEIIRRPESWRDSTALDAFAAFEGKSVLAVPKRDDVIPQAVTTLIGAALSKRSTFSVLAFNDATHQLGTYFKGNQAAREAFISELL